MATNPLLSAWVKDKKANRWDRWRDNEDLDLAQPVGLAYKLADDSGFSNHSGVLFATLKEAQDAEDAYLLAHGWLLG